MLKNYPFLSALHTVTWKVPKCSKKDQLQSLSSVLLWHVVTFLGGYASCYGVGCCVGSTVMRTIRHGHVKPVPYLHPTAWKRSRRLLCKLLNRYQNYNQIYWDSSDYFSEIYSKLRGKNIILLLRDTKTNVCCITLKKVKSTSRRSCQILRL